MRDTLIKKSIYNYQTYGGVQIKKLSISYELFGRKLHSAPIIVVNHALTGNSDLLSAEKGWWKTIIGSNKLIDTNKYTVLAFNIPGNGYDGFLIENYKDFVAKDIANVFLSILKSIGIKQLYAVIGGSIGGGIAWEMAVLEPDLINYLIPVACDWKSTDWIIGQCYIQENILNNSKKPLEDARIMAMLFYRTPASLSQKFNRTKSSDNSLFNVESWLQYHGDKLPKRFELLPYKLMNHLLSTIDITSNKGSFKQAVQNIKSTIIQIAVDTDLFFVAKENIQTKKDLDELKISNELYELKSVHGHDAFLIEFEQLTQILQPIFNYQKILK